MSKQGYYLFNQAQLDLIKNYSSVGLSKATGIPRCQCIHFIRNDQVDYRMSTLQRLAIGLGFQDLQEFLSVK